MHGERLAFDRELAQQKFNFDLKLAERRFEYDRDLHDHRRRVELAEVVLADFLQANDILKQIRFPGAFIPASGKRDS